MTEFGKSWYRIALVAAFVAVFSLSSVAAQEAEQGTLNFLFIGNSSFAITDGKVTIVSDFPYRSGASGAMQYKVKDVVLKGDVICLVTHGHFDHFDGIIFRQNAWGLIAPETVTDPLAGYRIYPTQEKMEYEGITVEAERTLHGRLVHYSYLVTWHGRRIYFVGDAERADVLLAMKDLDVAFVPPWILESVQDAGATIDAKKVVVYHHRRYEVVIDYQDRVVPKQGDTFTIDF